MYVILQAAIQQFVEIFGTWTLRRPGVSCYLVSGVYDFQVS